MRIAWIAFGSVSVRDGALTSDLASLRYRMLIPARALRESGHESDIVLVTGDDAAESLHARMRADAMVVTKLVPKTRRYTEKTAIVQHLAALARREGRPTLVDISDDHFRHVYFREFAVAADLVTVPTEQMAATVRSATGRPVAVIGDPYEGRGDSPRLELSHLARGARLRLLWFGFASNLAGLLVCAPQLLAAVRSPLELHIVTSPGRAEEYCARLARAHGERLLLRFTPWSQQSMPRAFQDCDAVIIPSYAADPQKRVKSANRVIESIRAGRFVLAHPLPSYLEFAPYAWIGEELAEGLGWLLANPREALVRLQAGQRHIETEYSPRAIARRWNDALSEASAGLRA